MPSPKDEEMKIRVPRVIKRAFGKIAGERFTSESEIAREALIEYLQHRNISLHDSAAELPPAQPPSQPVTYRKHKQPSSGAARGEADIAEGLAALAKGLKLSKQPPGKKKTHAGAAPK